MAITTIVVVMFVVMVLADDYRYVDTDRPELEIELESLQGISD